MTSHTAVKNRDRVGSMAHLPLPPRAGTMISEAELANPKTVGQRMTKRRLELGWTQAQVAKQVYFSPKTGENAGEENELSRNAYCMYETGKTHPDLPKVEAIAKVLGVTPQWLAFGLGERKTVDAYAFDHRKKDYVKTEKWVIPEEVLSDTFSARPEDLAIYMISDYSGEFKPGDFAIIKRDAEPTGIADPFLYKYRGEYHIDNLTRPHRSTVIRVFNDPKNKDRYDEIPANRIDIIGRVRGRILSK